MYMLNNAKPCRCKCWTMLIHMLNNADQCWCLCWIMLCNINVNWFGYKQFGKRCLSYALKIAIGHWYPCTWIWKLQHCEMMTSKFKAHKGCFIIFTSREYRTRATNSRCFNLKKSFWAFRLPHKKHIKTFFRLKT